MGIKRIRDPCSPYLKHECSTSLEEGGDFPKGEFFHQKLGDLKLTRKHSAGECGRKV